MPCSFKESRLFSNLSRAALARLSEITGSANYPKSATLFVEGQPSQGVFILHDGHVKLSTSSTDGKTLIVRISEPGELLGLPATISGRPYELTAQAIEPTKASFVSRTDFLSFLREQGEAALCVTQQLSETYASAFSELRMMALSHSAEEKLAQFLLRWTASQNTERDAIRMKFALTHEEIGQMIGVSRETVSRLFADFKKKQVLRVKHSTLVVKSISKLEEMAGVA